MPCEQRPGWDSVHAPVQLFRHWLCFSVYLYVHFVVAFCRRFPLCPVLSVCVLILCCSFSASFVSQIVARTTSRSAPGVRRQDKATPSLVSSQHRRLSTQTTSGLPRAQPVTTGRPTSCSFSKAPPPLSRSFSLSVLCCVWFFGLSCVLASRLVFGLAACLSFLVRFQSLCLVRACSRFVLCLFSFSLDVGVSCLTVSVSVALSLPLSLSLSVSVSLPYLYLYLRLCLSPSAYAFFCFVALPV